MDENESAAPVVPETPAVAPSSEAPAPIPAPENVPASAPASVAVCSNCDDSGKECIVCGAGRKTE